MRPPPPPPRTKSECHVRPLGTSRKKRPRRDSVAALGGKAIRLAKGTDDKRRRASCTRPPFKTLYEGGAAEALQRRRHTAFSRTAQYTSAASAIRTAMVREKT
jgi:hypothetical protein